MNSGNTKLPKFTCHLCNFSCNRKAHFETHLKTKKHNNKLRSIDNHHYPYNIPTLTQTLNKQNEMISKSCVTKLAVSSNK